jgi:hypothetical protein
MGNLCAFVGGHADAVFRGTLNPGGHGLAAAEDLLGPALRASVTLVALGALGTALGVLANLDRGVDATQVRDH